MTAKEYLSQAYRLNQLANTKMEQIENLRALSEKVTASYGSEQVSHSRNVTSMEDTVVRIVAAQDDLNRQLSEIVRLQVEISTLIDKVQNVNYSQILVSQRRMITGKGIGFSYRLPIMALVTEPGA